MGVSERLSSGCRGLVSKNPGVWFPECVKSGEMSWMVPRACYVCLSTKARMAACGVRRHLRPCLFTVSSGGAGPLSNAARCRHQREGREVRQSFCGSLRLLGAVRKLAVVPGSTACKGRGAILGRCILLGYLRTCVAVGEAGSGYIVRITVAI